MIAVSPPLGDSDAQFVEELIKSAGVTDCGERDVFALRHEAFVLDRAFAAAGLAGHVWQYFTLIPDVRSVGVREGVRAFEWPCVIRAVNTVDAMTATVERLPWPLMERLAERITHEVPGVNRVLFDLTPKPVGTIEWE